MKISELKVGAMNGEVKGEIIDLEDAREVMNKYGKSRAIQWFKQDGKGKADAVRKGFKHASKGVLMILDADLSAEAVDQRLHPPQPEAELSQGPLGRIRRIEHVLPFLRGHAGAVVRDHDLHKRRPPPERLPRR